MTKEDSKAMASFRGVKHSWRSSLAVVEFWKIGQGNSLGCGSFFSHFKEVEDQRGQLSNRTSA